MRGEQAFPTMNPFHASSLSFIVPFILLPARDRIMATTASMPASQPRGRFEHLGLVYRKSNQLQAQFSLLFQHAIMPLRRREAFLDCGAGDGTMTARIAPFFGRCVALEPDPSRRAALLAMPCRVDARTASIDAHEPPAGEAFDLVHCSHVLYYIPRDRWVATALRMASWLAPGGVLAIVLQAKDGQFQELFDERSSLRGQVDPCALAAALRDAGLDVCVASTAITVSCARLDDLCDVAALMLVDGRDALAPAMPAIRAWLETRCKQPRGGYVLEQPVAMLCCRRRDLAL